MKLKIELQTDRKAEPFLKEVAQEMDSQMRVKLKEQGIKPKYDIVFGWSDVAKAFVFVLNLKMMPNLPKPFMKMALGSQANEIKKEFEKVLEREGFECSAKTIF